MGPLYVGMGMGQGLRLFLQDIVSHVHEEVSIVAVCAGKDRRVRDQKISEKVCQELQNGQYYYLPTRVVPQDVELVQKQCLLGNINICITLHRTHHQPH